MNQLAHPQARDDMPHPLLKWADEIGLENVLKGLQDLQEEYGEDRYRPRTLLKRMVKQGKQFFEAEKVN